MRLAANSPDRLLATVGFYCLMIGSGFYLTQIISFSPIYPLLFVSLLLMIFTIGLRKVSLPPRSLVNGIVVLATLHFALHLVWVSPFNSALGFYFNFVFLGMAWRFLPYISRDSMSRALSVLIDFTIALGTIECIVRWFFPFQQFDDKFLEFVAESGSTFYMFKFNSIMYQDSNFVAMWLLVITMMAIGYWGFYRAPKRILFLCLLLGLTVCRSAIIFFIGYIILSLLKNYVASKGLRITLFVIAATGAIALLAHLIVNDESFQSKITIFTLVLANYFQGINLWTFLFGLGMSNSATLLDGIAAHNFVVEVLMDAGALGLSYVLFSLFYLGRMSGSTGKSVVWLFLLAGMSFAPVTIPYLYVVLCLLAFLFTPDAVQARSQRQSVDGAKYQAMLQTL